PRCAPAPVGAAGALAPARRRRRAGGGGAGGGWGGPAPPAGGPRPPGRRPPTVSVPPPPRRSAMTATIPVDASISRTPLPGDARDLATVCVLCSHNCGLRVDVAGGRIAEVRADETSPITHGYLCNKAFSIGHYVGPAQRGLHPLRRRPDGSFARIDWGTAVAEIAAKLAAIRAEHGGHTIALAGIGGQANHMDAAFGLSWLNAVGSKRWFNAFAQ